MRQLGRNFGIVSLCIILLMKLVMLSTSERVEAERLNQAKDTLEFEQAIRDIILRSNAPQILEVANGMKTSGAINGNEFILKALNIRKSKRRDNNSNKSSSQEPTERPNATSENPKEKNATSENPKEINATSTQPKINATSRRPPNINATKPDNKTAATTAETTDDTTDDTTEGSSVTAANDSIPGSSKLPKVTITLPGGITTPRLPKIKGSKRKRKRNATNASGDSSSGRRVAVDLSSSALAFALTPLLLALAR